MRDSTGRYIVKYPKKDNISNLIGESYSHALQRLECLERRLDKTSELKGKYHDFMSEFIELGHMRRVSENEDIPPVVHYLPHHPVLKESSTTTKVRSVFDASAKTSTGYALNDALLVGPVIQDDLLGLILRFRKYKVALSADIEKMYRQISIHPDDRSLQRLLWRFNKDDPITEYELTTVTYGLASSSFLATRTLHQLSDDEGESFTLAASALKRDFYMDDFICGEDSIERAIELRKQMDELLERGGFRLRKWCSNYQEALDGIPAENLATQSCQSFDSKETIKTLGICWDPKSDQFQFSIDPSVKEEPITKRKILSCIARLYDPLGLIAPIVVRAKILLQQLWALSLCWDEEVPLEIQNKWRRFIEELPNLINFRIDRYAFVQGKVQLHCFADASELAYGACLYARSEAMDGTVKVELLTSKSRVAPLKKRSIPRLELCAAQIAAHLFTKVQSALDMKVSSAWFWSDSMVVLHWLRSPSQNWKTFIANRVADIQMTTNGGKWQHVPGASNPADLLSRGMRVEQLLTNDQWQHGPYWLREGEENWPKTELTHIKPPEEVLERKTSSLVVHTSQPPNSLITRFSSYQRMIRTITYCLRFINNARGKEKESSSVLSLRELENSKITLIKIVQNESFGPEIRQLKKGYTVAKQSSLKLLNPFIDSTGLIRVGGRFRLSNQSYALKHPILIPGFHHFTRLLIISTHLKLLHGGISLTLATVRNEYWPINGRRAVRSIFRTCYRCFRVDPKLTNQPIGQLPPARITPSRPFTSTGIDYCGPIFVKSTNRKAAPSKAYVALFVCFCTKAVHIELVGDLSTFSFLSALRRFVARRGCPLHIYSDNGTNFIGAKNELNALYRMLNDRTETERIATSLATKGIQWHTIPPRAPHFGGLWESAVKVAKRHLLRQLGSTILFREDLDTILVQIEGCMNSRPLVPLSSDPNDLQALTPGHFLVGSSLQAVPEADLSDVPLNRLNRFQMIQRKVQEFWKQWQNEYLKELQRQSTINPTRTNFQVGQIVILQDQLLPPTRWPLARIIELHPGQDDIVRVVTLRTSTGILKRPVSKLCILPFDENYCSLTI